MRDKLYERAIYEIEEYKELHPQCTRADRFRILEAVTAIDEGTARKVDRYLRAIRECLPKDSRGAELEKEWKMPMYLWNEENETKQESLIFK